MVVETEPSAATGAVKSCPLLVFPESSLPASAKSKTSFDRSACSQSAGRLRFERRRCPPSVGKGYARCSDDGQHHRGRKYPHDLPPITLQNSDRLMSTIDGRCWLHPKGPRGAIGGSAASQRPAASAHGCSYGDPRFSSLRSGRVLKEEAHHFAAGIGAARIGVRAVRAAPRPCVPGALQEPLLQHRSSRCRRPGSCGRSRPPPCRERPWSRDLAAGVAWAMTWSPFTGLTVVSLSP